MQISVRSYLTASMTAVVGVGAIALAPVESGRVLSPAVVPAPVAADIALTALTLPFTDILSLLQTLGIGAAIPDITGLVPADLANAIATEFLNQATPLVTAAATDVFAAFNSTIAGLLTGPDSIPARFGGAVADIPTVLVTAFQALSTGDVPTALQALSTGLVAPITSIGQAVMDASDSFQSFVTAQINSVTTALPGVLLSAVSAVITNNLQSVLALVQNAISGLTFGLIPPAASTPALAAARTTGTAVQAVATVPVSVSVAPRSAAAQVDVTPDATSPAVDIGAADVADVVESSAPAVVSDQTAAPRRPSVAHRSARAGSVVTAAAAESQPKQAASPRAARSANKVSGSE